MRAGFCTHTRLIAAYTVWDSYRRGCSFVLRTTSSVALCSCVRWSNIHCESKNPPWYFLTFFPKRLGIFSPNFRHLLIGYYTFLSTLDYKFLFNYLQLWRSYSILSATIIMCSKCPPSTEVHAGWSQLTWHNFVTVGDNYSRPSGVCRYGRLFWIACVFSFFFFI